MCVCVCCTLEGSAGNISPVCTCRSACAHEFVCAAVEINIKQHTLQDVFLDEIWLCTFWLIGSICWWCGTTIWLHDMVFNLSQVFGSNLTDLQIVWITAVVIFITLPQNLCILCSRHLKNCETVISSFIEFWVVYLILSHLFVFFVWNDCHKK